MEELILFILSFVFVFIVYQFLFVAPIRKNKKKKELLEIRYLQSIYKLNIQELSYPQLLQICAIVSSIDISIAVGVIALMPNFWLKLLVGFILIIGLIGISYHLVYLFYKRKGMKKDGKH